MIQGSRFWEGKEVPPWVQLQELQRTSTRHLHVTPKSHGARAWAGNLRSNDGRRLLLKVLLPRNQRNEALPPEDGEAEGCLNAAGSYWSLVWGRRAGFWREEEKKHAGEGGLSCEKGRAGGVWVLGELKGSPALETSLI